MESAVTDLPDPDSPTIATVSPGETRRSNAFTATKGPSSVAKLTVSPEISSSVASGAAGEASGTRHPLGRRILEVQCLAGADDPKDGVCRHRGLAEALQDQLQLAGVGHHVADREHAGQAGLARRRIDADVVPVQRQAPVGDRAEVH